jgi:hypothetical protein
LLPRKKGDEALPNSIKRKHPKKGREKETKGKDEKSRQAGKPPKKRWPTLRKGKH